MSKNTQTRKHRSISNRRNTMADLSSIEWTEATWNPLTGCTKISPGCKYCYAERLALRLRAMGQPNYANGFKLTLHEPALDIPLRWREPKRIFVNSMSDLFHAAVPFAFIVRVFETMQQAHWHTFQVLTKRSDRLLALSDRLPWAPNIWMGVSIESAAYLWRAEHLRSTAAHIRFLSLEPLLGPLPRLNLKGIHWVIVGGESGPRYRSLNRAWAAGIRDLLGSVAVKRWDMGAATRGRRAARVRGDVVAAPGGVTVDVDTPRAVPGPP